MVDGRMVEAGVWWLYGATSMMMISRFQDGVIIYLILYHKIKSSKYGSGVVKIK